MATIILVNSFILPVVFGIATFKGLDLKKRSSWLFGLYVFISGFLIGFLRSDGNGGYHLVTNWALSFQVGIIFTCIVLIGSTTTRWQRDQAKKYEDLAEKGFQDKLKNLAEELFKEESNKK